MLDQIASALNRNDETPNIELAEKLAQTKDSDGIAEIAAGLTMNQATANDCIKVLYEVGERDPDLIIPHVGVFLDLLKSKNNRLVWGAMTALSQISAICPDELFPYIDDIYSAYKTGSVITIDNSISVFANICRGNLNNEKAILPLLFKHFENCRAKEIPQHFERASVCITPNNAEQFKAVIKRRYDEMSKSQQARVNKVLKKLEL